jgi:hypothetical protein
VPNPKGIHLTILERAHVAAEIAIDFRLDNMPKASTGALGGVHVRLAQRTSKFGSFCFRRRASRIRAITTDMTPAEIRAGLSSVELEVSEFFGSLNNADYWAFSHVGGYNLSNTYREAAWAGAKAFCRVLEQNGIGCELVERSLSVTS